MRRSVRSMAVVLLATAGCYGRPDAFGLPCTDREQCGDTEFYCGGAGTCSPQYDCIGANENLSFCSVPVDGSCAAVAQAQGAKPPLCQERFADYTECLANASCTELREQRGNVVPGADDEGTGGGERDCRVLFELFSRCEQDAPVPTDPSTSDTGGSTGGSSSSTTGTGSSSSSSSTGSSGSSSSSSGSSTAGSSSSSTTGPADNEITVFVTRAAFTGALDGVAGADSKCQSAASLAGLDGRYRAWIATSAGDAPASRFERQSGSVARVDGTTVATSWADLVDGDIEVAILVDERGNALDLSTAGGRVWTNVTGAGQATGGEHCGSFTSASGTGAYGLADVPFTDAAWTQVASQACTERAHLYCFEQ